MATTGTPRLASAPAQLEAVRALIRKHRLIEGLVHRQGEADPSKASLVDDLTHRQNLSELQKRLEALHPADVAYVLEGLPLEDRLLVWSLVRTDRDGEILLEVSDAVRDSLLADMDNAEIV